jgi:hypothetical protein
MMQAERTRIDLERHEQENRQKQAALEITEVENVGQRSISEAIPKYDLVAGYYIVMGGFVTRFSKDSNGFPVPDIGGKQFSTLTPGAVIGLANARHFLQVQTRTIQDKSKADILAKGLVCFQVLWMLVEVSDTKITLLKPLFAEISHRAWLGNCQDIPWLF